jgi:hypothetical protein
MKHRKGKVMRVLACTYLASLMTAGCASDRTRASHAGNGRQSETTNRQAQSTTPDTNGTNYNQNRGVGGSSGPDTFHTDTVYRDTGAYRNNPGTGGAGGSGVGGGAMPDSGYNDSLGIYGPTGPLPGDTGVGGGIPPGPDTSWRDTLAPPDTSALPDGRANGSGGSGGPSNM